MPVSATPSSAQRRGLCTGVVMITLATIPFAVSMRISDQPRKAVVSSQRSAEPSGESDWAFSEGGRSATIAFGPRARTVQTKRECSTSQRTPR